MNIFKSLWVLLHIVCMAVPSVCMLLSVGLHPEFVIIPPKCAVPSLCGLYSSFCVVFLQSIYGPGGPEPAVMGMEPAKHCRLWDQFLDTGKCKSVPFLTALHLPLKCICPL